MKNRQTLTIVVSVLVGAVLGFVVAGLLFGFGGAGLLGAGVTSGGAGANQPTYGEAVVDGQYVSDWNLGADFFANMYRAGKTDKPVEAKLYLRYDCGGGILYALVLSEAGRPVDTTSAESWLAINSRSSKASFTAFQFVYSGSTAVGWEGSIALGQGSYTLWAHSNVDNGGWQTAEAPGVALTLDCYEPTAVFLNYFKAESTQGGVMLSWETASEIDNLGFNVYRGASAGGPWTKLNGDIIPSQAPPGSQFGATYGWLDAQGTGRNFYLLEDIDLSGAVTPHGPAKVTGLMFFGVKP
jgi:hypothetical protein